MIEHTHAPGWRGRPTIRGPIEDADWMRKRSLSGGQASSRMTEGPAIPVWLRNLEALAPWGCVGIACGLLAAAALTWILGQ